MTTPVSLQMNHSKESCRICGPTKFRPFTTRNGFHLQRCERCQLVQITDDLSKLNLADYYDEDFFDDTYSWLQRESGRNRECRKFNYRMDQIEKLKPERGTILDVGCSFGYFLDVARSREWDTIGVEIGEHAAKFAQRELSLEVHITDVSHAPLRPDSVDVITYWNVLEHLDEPVKELRRANELLKDGGLLVFTTGDIDCYLRKLQGLRWRYLIPPVHIAYYNQQSVGALLHETGFLVEQRSVALPREALLRKLGIIGFLKGIRFSDKMMIFARKQNGNSLGVQGTPESPRT